MITARLRCCVAMAAAGCLAACGDDLAGVAPDRILFIRGGDGTGGFVSGGADSQLSDIHDVEPVALNTGFGQLAQLLQADGFEVEQVIEGPVAAPRPVELGALELHRYRVVVFASNNAAYDEAAADLVARYVRAGGAALFISDANWGLTFDHAPTSDQIFLSRFGLVMNQDGGGVVTLTGADLLVPEHPILDGVSAFSGEGVSPCTLTPGSAARRLVAARAVVRRNTAPTGPLTEPTADDASLAVVEAGRGRVACHFDRNTFFNDNGGGSSLAVADNRRYAHNLFAWLAGRR